MKKRNAVTTLRGQALTEYVLMIAVVLGLVIAAGFIFSDKLEPVFNAMKERIRSSILGGGLQRSHMRETRGTSGIDTPPSSPTIPYYSPNFPKKKRSNESDSKE